jgi:hypothetical protein
MHLTTWGKENRCSCIYLGALFALDPPGVYLKRNLNQPILISIPGAIQISLPDPLLNLSLKFLP